MRPETEAEYERMALSFIKERLTKKELRATPKNIKDALLGCAGEYRPVYWRKLRLALVHQQKDAGHHESSAAIRELKNPITKGGDYSKIKPKAVRVKAVKPEDETSLLAYLRDVSRDKELVAAVYLVTVTGIRPAEFGGLSVSGELVKVAGAKHSHGGLRGADRTLQLDAATVRNVGQCLRVLQGVQVGRLQDRLKTACKNLWPRRAHLPSLYSFRHQMGSDLKASGLGRREIAYIMGHQATGSVDVYGDRRVARSGGRSLPNVPQGADLSAIRETHNEKTAKGYKPAKARTVSKKINRVKGMDSGGFDM